MFMHTPSLAFKITKSQRVEISDRAGPVVAVSTFNPPHEALKKRGKRR